MKDLSARQGHVANATAWLLCFQERDLVPIVQEARWAPGPVWTAAKNLVNLHLLLRILWSCLPVLVSMIKGGFV
jgi:hypothetical protein